MEDDPFDRAAVEARRKAVEEADRILQESPDYPKAQNDWYEVRISYSQGVRDPKKTDEERHKLTVIIYEQSAKAFLPLVSDIRSQNAYVTILQDWLARAWLDYAGYPINGVIESGHPQVEELLNQFAYWRNEGFKKLSERHHRATAPQIKNAAAGPPAHPPKISFEPETFQVQLKQLLETSRLTVEQVAEAIGVQPRSVYRHLSGESKPYKRHIAAYERVFSEILKTN